MSNGICKCGTLKDNSPYFTLTFILQNRFGLFFLNKATYGDKNENYHCFDENKTTEIIISHFRLTDFFR